MDNNPRLDAAKKRARWALTEYVPDHIDHDSHADFIAKSVLAAADAVDPRTKNLDVAVDLIRIRDELACTECDGDGKKWEMNVLRERVSIICPRCEAKTLRLGGLFTDPDLNVEWCVKHNSQRGVELCEKNMLMHYRMRQDPFARPTCRFGLRVLVGGDK